MNNALARRLSGVKDSRGALGIAARGKNIYRMGSRAAHQGGGVQYGRPRKDAVVRRMRRGSVALSDEEYVKLLQELQQATARQYGNEYDSTYDAAVRALMGETTQTQAGLKGTEQRLGEDFNRNIDTLGRQRQEGLQRTEQSFADRGMLRSGANLVAQQRMGDAYQRSVQGANTAKERALGDLASQQASTFANVRGRLSQADASAAERARVREETRRWQQEQAAIEARRLQQEEDFQRRQLEIQEQTSQRLAEQLAAMQPIADDTGSYELQPIYPPEYFDPPEQQEYAPEPLPESPVAQPVPAQVGPAPTYTDAQAKKSTTKKMPKNKGGWF